jgi:hypothetical protein
VRGGKRRPSRRTDFETGSAELMANLVLGLSMEQSVVVLIDDSHFMDIGSWQVTLRLADLITTRNARILVVLLHRALVLADAFTTTAVPANGSAGSSKVGGGDAALG